ncbi:MAG: DUF2796 domain-containing protein [Pseudomonadales bacterium]
MLKPYSLITALLFSSMLIAAPQPQHNHSDKHPEHSQKAHLHGTAKLTLALEDNTVEISLESPAANIVGFEHKATSEKHIKAVEEAKASLEAPSLFSFSGSNCSLKQAEVDMSSVIEQGCQHSDYEGHSEISANYSYECSKGEKLETVSVNLMSRFPAIETLEVIWLTSRQQGATKLKSQSNLIRIR